jgi:hypothetical protein
MNDHDLLVQLAEDMKWIKTGLENHLHGHFQYSLMAWGTALAAIVALVLAILQ